MMKEQIRGLIGQNKLFEAIKKMRSQQTKEKDKNSLAMIESRLNDLNEKNRLGVVSEENVTLELNKIRNSLLGICNNLAVPLEELSSETRLKRKIKKAVIGIGILLAISVVIYMATKEKTCDERKIAILVADFQNTENDSEIDGFANTLVTRMDNWLEDSIYDVTPVGFQPRGVKKYNDYIRTEHFESTCDTSGIFVNGFLSKEQKVFNAYITIANMQMKTPELSQKEAIILDNPSGIEFSITNDANFLADFILAIIKSYEGKPYESLEKLFELEKNGSSEGLENDNNIKATIAHFKGNCYAMRGDNNRAKAEYGIANKYGNPELKQAAKHNKETADHINERMQENPELRKRLNRNVSEHSKFEEELEAFLNQLGRDLNKIKLGKIFSKRN